MVLLHVKGSDKIDQFIVEHVSTDTMNDITWNVIVLWNLRIRIRAVAEASKAMAKFGTLRPEAERGITDLQIFKESFPESVTNPMADPDGQRMGNAPPEHAAITLIRTADEALEAISENHAIQRKCLTIPQIEEHLKLLDGAITICYSNGLPEWDTLYELIEGKVDAPHWDLRKIYDPEKAQLWFATKKLMRGQLLSKYAGNNEKTKIVIKIVKDGSRGAPVRESAIDEDTHKRMLSYWHKKQEMEKKLQDDDDDSYLTSSWADPRSYKRSFAGTEEIRWK